MKKILFWCSALSMGAALIPAAGSRVVPPPPDSSALSEKDFADPPLEARPGALWTWMNGYVDMAQIRRELEEMKAKGMRGAIIWDIGSLADPDKIIPAGPAFLGKESLAAIHGAMDAAADLGLELGISAASSWNAGGAWIGPEDASRALLWSETAIDGPRSFDGVLPLPKNTGNPHEDVAVLAVPDEKGNPSPEAAAVIDLGRSLDPAGRLKWDVPKGRWRILRFVGHNTGQLLECPSPRSKGLVIDHLSRKAIDDHLTFMLGRLREGRKDLGPLKYFFFDSYEVQEGTDWTVDWLQEFRRRYGYDPVLYFPAFAGRVIGSPEISRRFLHDAQKNSSDLIIGHHYRRATELLNKNGVKVIAEAGHGGSARVDVLKAMGAVDYPMGEFWNHERFWVTKEAASAAHIYGKKFIPAESLTGWRHWQDGPLAYKRLIDIAFCAGLNQVTFHTFAHNPPEAGKPGFAYHAGEHLNVNSTWWNYSKPLMDYLARCSYMLQQGRFVADVCLYYGDQAPNLVPSRRIDPSVKPVFDAAAQCLHCGAPRPVQVSSLGPGYDYDYVDEEVLVNRMRVENGRIVLPDGLSYRLLVLPDRTDISLAVLKKIEGLIEAGAIVVGPKPDRSNSLQDYPHCDDAVRAIAAKVWGPAGDERIKDHSYGLGRVTWDRPLKDVLAKMGIGPDFSVENIPNDDQHIDYIHRRTKSEDFYFVSNSALQAETVPCTFRVEENRRPFLWDPADGSIVPCADFERAAGGIRLTLSMPPVASIFVVFREDEARGKRRSIKPAPMEEARERKDRPAAESIPAAVPLARAWTLSFPEGWGAPASLSSKELIDWTGSPDPGVRYFSGTASYANSFVIPAGPRRKGDSCILDLGKVKEVAEVFINGKSAGILWKEPFRADITPFVKAGDNTLVVTVTNLWNNRIVGDLQPNSRKAYTRTNIKNKFKANTPLIPSGLFGPVTLSWAPKPRAAF